MKIYVLKNEAGEYLCYDSSYGMMFVDKDFKLAMQYKSWYAGNAHALSNNALGKFSLYRWTITEEKDEE
jgi:hypothetical protein